MMSCQFEEAISVAVKSHNSQHMWIIMELKKPGLIASDFFQTFWDHFGIRRKLVFFPLSLVNFKAKKMYRLEDINEKLTSYGNHN